MSASVKSDGSPLLEDRVHIDSTKRAARKREVPRVSTPVRPELSQDRFQKVLAKAGVSPYQGRKTFARLMDEAQVPRQRRIGYMGHADRDVTDVYERYEVDAFLAEDAARLKKVIEAARTKAKTLEAALV